MSQYESSIAHRSHIAAGNSVIAHREIGSGDEAISLVRYSDGATWYFDNGSSRLISSVWGYRSANHSDEPAWFLTRGAADEFDRGCGSVFGEPDEISADDVDLDDIMVSIPQPVAPPSPKSPPQTSRVRYVLRDTGGVREIAHSLHQAAEMAAEWYETDEPADLRTDSVDALQASIASWEERIAKTEGYEDFYGHGTYVVTAASAAGMNLQVTRFDPAESADSARAWLADNGLRQGTATDDDLAAIYDAADDGGVIQAAEMVMLFPGAPTLHTTTMMESAFLAAGCVPA